MMKLCYSALSLSFACSLLHATATFAQSTESLEVPLDKAFVPPLGFDDNDNVQAVLTGYLPNSCYQLKSAVVDRDSEGRPVRVRQLAEKKTDGICAESESLPPHLNAVVPFTTEVSLGDARSGRLPVGAYVLSYSRRDTSGTAQDASRAFTVEPALRPTVDNMQYGSVTTAAVASVVRSGEPVSALLGVLLTSTCTELSETLTVRQVGDVTVVLPTLRVQDNLLCAFVLRDVNREVELGRYDHGTYLLHIRSKNGQAVNRVFTANGG